MVDCGSRLSEMRKTLLSWVTFWPAKTSTRSPHSACAGVAMSSAAAQAASFSSPELPAARCEDPDSEEAIGGCMGDDGDPEVAGAHVDPAVSHAGDESREPLRVFGGE